MKKLVISCIIFLSCLLVGCSNNFLISTGSTDLDPKKIHINFNAFSKTDTKEINTVSIDEIDLSEITIAFAPYSFRICLPKIIQHIKG